MSVHQSFFLSVHNAIGGGGILKRNVFTRLLSEIYSFIFLVRQSTCNACLLILSLRVYFSWPLEKQMVKLIRQFCSPTNIYSKYYFVHLYVICIVIITHFALNSYPSLLMDDILQSLLSSTLAL